MFQRNELRVERRRRGLRAASGETVVQLRHIKLGKASRETVSSGGGQL